MGQVFFFHKNFLLPPLKSNGASLIHVLDKICCVVTIIKPFENKTILNDCDRLLNYKVLKYHCCSGVNIPFRNIFRHSHSSFQNTTFVTIASKVTMFLNFIEICL